MKKVSIIIPIYNEKETLLKILERVEKADTLGLEKQIILVDDASTDGTHKILKELEEKFLVVYHQKNAGKGVALRTGFKKVSGDIVLIQDADLELDPADYPNLLKPILENRADFVIGSRYRPENVSLYRTYYLGGKFISCAANLFYGSNISDIYCGYKAFLTPILDNMDLKSNAFEIEIELTIKALKKGKRIVEVPISYYPRSFKQGKKIRWSNGLKALWLIIKHKFVA